MPAIPIILFFCFVSSFAASKAWVRARWRGVADAMREACEEAFEDVRLREEGRGGEGKRAGMEGMVDTLCG